MPGAICRYLVVVPWRIYYLGTVRRLNAGLAVTREHLQRALGLRRQAVKLSCIARWTTVALRQAAAQLFRLACYFGPFTTVSLGIKEERWRDAIKRVLATTQSTPASPDTSRLSFSRDIESAHPNTGWWCWGKSEGATHQSPLPRPSPLPVLASRLELWPAAAEAKLDGMCEGIMDR